MVRGFTRFNEANEDRVRCEDQFFFVLSSLDVLLNKIGAIGTASKNQHYQ